MYRQLQTDKCEDDQHGKLFKLTYVVKLKKDINQKDMIDKLRVRNGNLEIMLAQVDSGDTTL